MHGAVALPFQPNCFSLYQYGDNCYTAIWFASFVVVVLIEIKLRHRWKQIHGGSTPRRLWVNNIGLGSEKKI